MDAETLDLARLQFAITSGAHFLFVALTLGLAVVVAAVQTRATASGSDAHWRMTRFWGQLYVINYGMGIVTGLVMEFQFGLSWSGLTTVAGDVFGAPLAMEALVAFFIESTFLGLWIFGWGRINRWVHLALLWVVALTAYASAYWVIAANGWLQNPVGAERRGDRMVLVDRAALLANPDALIALAHVAGAGLLAGGLFVAGVSAYHLRRRGADEEVFRRSLRTGLIVAAPAALFTVGVGFNQFRVVAGHLPMKYAVSRGDTAERERLQAELAARFGPGDYSPPDWIDIPAALMINLGTVLLVLTAVNLALAYRTRAGAVTRFCRRLLTWSIVLPFVAAVAGWVFREVGRQPWAINQVLLTEDALSPSVSAGSMRLTLIAFTALFAALIALDAWLLARYARRGPEGATLGVPPVPDEEPEPVPQF
ncbi:cytochrome ubiquinol oxidase subunit I [Actinomadura rubrobrunea]|uniref:Cytochrome ubiquinol oxidase subunit I n=1 Tax=Actinomadura rubrobrunea TaxID=115335 RepID=A0A9W6UTR3_9ACTN|nr:cytochrome ubiquinol oxidase subunit I [Actinomadura rubrobrunea]GLW63901.1 cytochrome ubiquinol oxidase subunit I [Actinomadura rubrobrunea]